MRPTLGFTLPVLNLSFKAGTKSNPARVGWKQQ
jgi:hypothetical protein